MRIGPHLSIRNGLSEAGRLAVSLGADTFGFHSRNPRGSAARSIPSAEIEAWRRTQSETGLGPLIGHLPYIINLASPTDLWELGCRIVREDLARCDAFGAFALVLHPGHRSVEERAAGIERVVAGVRTILAASADVRTLLLLEGMAGQTGEIGGIPTELGAIIEGAGAPAGLGVCLDTCHLFAAGYDLRTREGIDGMLAEFDRAVGAERIRALHLNDSRFGCGSHKDRHERLGRGELGTAGLTAILTHPRLQALPMIIETPVPADRDYAEEVATARQLSQGTQGG